MYIQREHFLNQQNPLELFKVSPVLRFPVLFFLDSISWNGAFGSGTPDSIVQAGRTEGKTPIEITNILHDEKIGKVMFEVI